MKNISVTVFLFSGIAGLLGGCAGGGGASILSDTSALLTHDGLIPVESVCTAPPVREIRAEDGSFILTAEKFAGAPFYSVEEGPHATRVLRAKDGMKNAGKTVPVRIVADGFDKPLYGRLAIFRQTNPEKYRLRKDAEEKNLNITITPEAISQMESNGIGFSTKAFSPPMGFIDMSSWALWISKEPIPE